MQSLFQTPEVWFAIVVAAAIVAFIFWRGRPKAVLEEDEPLSPHATPENPRECPPYRSREAQPAREADTPPTEPRDERKRRAEDDGPHATFDDARYDSLSTADYAHDEVAEPTINSQQADNATMSDLLKDPVADRREQDIPLPITADNLPPTLTTTTTNRDAADTGWEAPANEK